jgi:ribose 5-phosphate isomerase B
MKIAIGNDHTGTLLKKEIITLLEDRGIEVIDCGTGSTEASNYPVYGYAVGRLVADKKVDGGITICGTGIGISLAAGKIDGVRAAVVSEPVSAELTKRHNNANVLSFGARIVGTVMAKEIVTAWLDAEYEGGRHQKRIDMLTEIEETQKLSETE